MAKDSTAAARSQRVTKKGAATGKGPKIASSGELVTTKPKSGRLATTSPASGTSKKSASAVPSAWSGGFARRTVTLPPDLVAQIDRIVGRGQFSAFMAEAARRQVARDNLEAFLAESGPVGAEARDRADQALAEAFERMNTRVATAVSGATSPAAAAKGTTTSPSTSSKRAKAS